MTSSFARATARTSPGFGSKVCTSPFFGTRLVTSTRSPPTLRTMSAKTVVVATTWMRDAAPVAFGGEAWHAAMASRPANPWIRPSVARRPLLRLSLALGGGGRVTWILLERSGRAVLSVRLAVGTLPEDFQAVRVDHESGRCLDAAQDGPEAQLSNLHRSAAGRADDVVVVGIGLAGHVGVISRRKIDALDEVEVGQELEGAKDGRPADDTASRARCGQDVLRGEVAILFGDRLRDRAARGGQALSGPPERRDQGIWLGHGVPNPSSVETQSQLGSVGGRQVAATEAATLRCWLSAGPVERCASDGARSS